MTRDLLVEIGTEELPPKALASLIDSFSGTVETQLDDVIHLPHGTIHAYATPRRLAVLIEDLAETQSDQTVSMKGPPVRVAFDADGQPTKAALAFAEKCGVDIDELGREETDKGEWLVHTSVVAGQSMRLLIGSVIEVALMNMPIPRRMRWGSSSVEFVRPVHWITLLYGTEALEFELFGVRAGNTTYGHRFMSEGPLALDKASDYRAVLEGEGHVIVDMDSRRKVIVDGVRAAAAAAGGSPVGDDDLYDEVNALVEWPVPVTGSFDARFLELPREVVVSTLTSHQRYFPVEDAKGSLLPRFITVANLDSAAPELVVDGNERVIRPRLEDAEFFWRTDRSQTLESRREPLSRVVYQQQLGTLADKTDRVRTIAARIAGELSLPTEHVERAALLCKCDLVSGMVGEFPELQGIMGRYYALADGEPDDVADAIEAHYRPRFAGDAPPTSATGLVLATADRIDTLAGLFAAGKRPSGNRDPFGLRRAALGVVRLLIEGELAIDLTSLIEYAIELQPTDIEKDAVTMLHAFITERLKGYVLDRGTPIDHFEAVAAAAPQTLTDFIQRLDAVNAFVELDAAESLAAANKRIANILKKSERGDVDEIDTALFDNDAERALYDEMGRVREQVTPKLANTEYTDALTVLAGLRQPVDDFFDNVMVLADDAAVRRNRLALLSDLQQLFGGVADISRLSIG